MNVAAGGGREPPHRRRVGGSGGQPCDAQPHQAAMDRAPTQGRRTTAVQDLRDIVEGQPQLGAQFGDKGFLLGGGTGMELVPDVGAIVDPAGALPFIDGGHSDAEFAGQGRGAFGGGLDVATGGGGGAS